MKAAFAASPAGARRGGWTASAPFASAIKPVAVLVTCTSLLVSAFAWVADPQAGLGSAAAMLVGLWVFVTSFGVWLGALHSMGALRADLSLLHRRAAPQAAAAQTLQQAQRLWAGWALALLPPTLVFSVVGTGRWADPLHLAGPALQVLLFALAWTHAAAWHGLRPAWGLLAGLAVPVVWGWWAFSTGGPRLPFEHQPAALAGLCALALLAVASVAKDLGGRAAFAASTTGADGAADRLSPCQRWNAWWTRRAWRWQPLDPSSGWGFIILCQAPNWLSRPDSWLRVWVRVWGDDVGFTSAMALTLMTFFLLASLRTDALHWRLLLAPGPGGRRWLGFRILQASAGFMVIYLGALTLVLAAVFGVVMEMLASPVDWTAWARVASKVWVPLGLDLATALCLAVLSRRLGLGWAMGLWVGITVLLGLAAWAAGSAFTSQPWWPRNAWSNAAQGLLILGLAWAANQAWRSVDLAQLMKQRQKALDEQAEVRGEGRFPRR
jgi:hypothetical protein